MDAPSILPNACSQRIEIQRRERAPWFHIPEIMRDEQLALDQVNICLDAAETAIKRVQERPCVFIVVVGVSLGERDRLGCANERGEGQEYRYDGKAHAIQ
jgi:hypothetical protein